MLLGDRDDAPPHVEPEVVVDSVVAPWCLGQTQRLVAGVVVLEALRPQDIGYRRRAGEHFEMALAIRRFQQVGIAGGETRRDTEVLGVIGHHEKVEGATQSRLAATGGANGLSLGESIGLIGRCPGAHAECVAREVRVHMGVAPVHVVRVVLTDRGTVGLRSIRRGYQGQDENQDNTHDLYGPYRLNGAYRQ